MRVAGKGSAGMSSEGAQFTRRVEDFSCGHCGKEVTGTGYTNHCPRCLWSRHVDILPGDREAECGALMEPVGVLYEGGGYVIVQRCTGCAHTWRNKSAPGDSQKAILGLAGKPVETSRPEARTPSRRRSTGR
jgi:RNHCP domain